MTVEELIKLLEAMPKDAVVKFDDCEYGPQDIDSIRINNNYPYNFYGVLIE